MIASFCYGWMGDISASVRSHLQEGWREAEAGRCSGGNRVFTDLGWRRTAVQDAMNCQMRPECGHGIEWAWQVVPIFVQDNFNLWMVVVQGILQLNGKSHIISQLYNAFLMPLKSWLNNKTQENRNSCIGNCIATLRKHYEINSKWRALSAVHTFHHDYIQHSSNGAWSAERSFFLNKGDLGDIGGHWGYWGDITPPPLLTREPAAVARWTMR